MAKRSRRRTTAPEQAALRSPLSIAVSPFPPVATGPLLRTLAAYLSFSEILATLLNGGTSPTTSHQLLQPSTVDEMFTNQIPQFPDFGRQGVPAAKPDLTNPLPNLYPEDPDTPQGWGLTFMLTHLKGGAGGRGQGTAWCAGLANLFWWCDREKGVAGMVASQILPFGGILDFS